MNALAAAALGLPWSGIMITLYDIYIYVMLYMLYDCVVAPLWLCYGDVVAAATAPASTRTEAVLWLPDQPRENKSVCSSYGSFQPLS